METLGFVLGTTMLALAAHPFATYPLSLALLRRLRAPAPVARGDGQPQSFSLLVCAHNEAAVIGDKVRNLQALLDAAPGPAEALVYVDGSSDATAAIVRAAGDPRITVVEGAVRSGKTAGLNRLVARARGDLLVLSDANVTVEPEALAKLARHFADPAVGLVCGHLRYVNGGESVTARNGTLYWRLEELTRELEAATGSAIGADGSLYAVRRTLWPAVPDDLIDDFYVPMTVRFQGLRVIRGGDVMAYERSAGRAREEFRRKVRIACQAFNVHRRLWPEVRRLPALDRYKYVSHKLLKWLAGFHLTVAAGGFLAGLGATLGPADAALLAACGLLALALGAVLRLPPLPAALDALVMLSAVSLGVVRSLQGERFQTWQPAASVRALATLETPPTRGAS